MKTSHGSLIDITPKSPTLTIDDPISHLPILHPHTCFTHLPNHDSTQKLTITRNSKVSPLADIADTITRCSSASSPLAHGYANTNHLLSHPPMLVPMTNPSHPPTHTNKKIRAFLSKPLRYFRRKCSCPCSDKKSVQVKESAVPKSKTQMPLPSPPPSSHGQITRDSVSLRNLETKDKSAMNLETADDMVPVTNLQSQRVPKPVRPFGDGFTFPVLTPKSSDGEPPRDPMEAQGPTDVGPTGIIDDDAASDASSDLFEIESFSVQTTSTNAVIYRRRDSLDEASNNRLLFSTEESVTSTVTECYEPSEASVTIPEGCDRTCVGDFSVGASEFGDGGDRPPEKCKRRSSSGNGFFSIAFAT